MSRYKAYSEHKDSGIHWLNNIPTHWGLVRFKNIFKIQKRIAGVLGHDVLSITQRGVKIKDTESGDGQLSMDYSKYQLVHKNDFAMNHMDLLTGYVDISKFDGVTSPDYRVFTLADENQHPKYFLYLLQLCYIAKIFYPLGQGAAQIGRWRLPTEAFSEFVAPTPDYAEQQRIAAFLDHETAKIDALIEKQQRLIDLLKEKRQAVISHAVTKGLNPSAPMKDSGVEWLGEVPAHWEMKKLKYLGDARNGLTYSPDDVVDEDEGTLVLRSSNVQNMRITFDDNVYVNKSIQERIFTRLNDILICSRNGSRALIGKNALIGEEAIGMAYGAFMMIFRSTFNQYLFWVLNSQLFEYQSGSFLTSTINQLTVENINGFEIPLPPEEERLDIIRHIQDKTSKIDGLIGRALSSVSFIQERRTALISAAVTGKIDVRDWQAAA